MNLKCIWDEFRINSESIIKKFWMNLKWIWKEFEMNLKWILNPFQTHSKFISSPFQINHQWISSEFDENEFATWKATHSIIDREDGRRWRWAIRNRSSSPSSATWPSGSGTTPAHKSIISIRHQSNYISTSQRQSSLNSMDEAATWPLKMRRNHLWNWL